MPNMPTPSMLAKTSPVSHDPARQDNLPQFLKGDRVWIQDPKSKKWLGQTTIEAIRRNARSYVVTLDDGGSRILNRIFL